MVNTIPNPIISWIKIWRDIPGAFWLMDDANNKKRHLCIPFQERHSVVELHEFEEHYITLPKDPLLYTVEVETQKLMNKRKAKKEFLDIKTAIRRAKHGLLYYSPICIELT